jgi:MoaA/NifB/PqqE/SkfB family radical SAM enzyme
MSIRSKLTDLARPALEKSPGLKRSLKAANDVLTRWHHAAAEHVPSLIQPTPEILFISITGQCNFRCIGCRYERDFMLGEKLDLATVRTVLEDARDAGVRSVRLYGGEPLLHPDLPAMVRHGTELGLDMYVTTNGSLLDKRIEELWNAGLRWLTIGFYGEGDVFAGYTQRAGLVGRVATSLERVRERYGPDQLSIQLNFVVIKPLATLETLAVAWELVQRHELYLHFDLYGYSIPFFTPGPEGELEFRAADEPELRQVIERVLALRQAHPERFPHSEPFLRSIPDWVMQKADMRIPCDAYRFLWVGPDGSVQLCDTSFPLGNVKQKRLREIAFSPAHKAAARGAFKLECPNCTCQVEDRIRKHGPSWRRYSKGGGA